jgi:hypothetical protein
MMLKIPLAALLLSCLSLSAVAQTPVTMSDDMADERGANTLPLRKEAQPPGQGGQAQQMMKEARVELERAALALKGAEADKHSDAVHNAQQALLQFEESLGQLHQSIPGYVPLSLATSLHEQVSRTLLLLESDMAAATLSMHELSLRVTDLSAEADLLIGRSLLGHDRIKLGLISNVLITADGRIEALIVDRMGPNRDRQVTIEWIDVSIEGTNLVANIDFAEAEKRPDYVAD